jgi:hypothetical protein
MLKKTIKTTLEGKCFVNDQHIATFRATIDSENPADGVIFGETYLDKAACKEHRAIVRADEAEFQDYAYEKQDEMLLEIEA